MEIVDLPVENQGKDYSPYIKTYTFSSKGRVSRVMGLKTGRLHHLQSDNQYRAFMIFEWADKVIDIRESYPLLDLKETIDDIEDLKLEKFTDKETGKEFILTTPFLLTVQEPDGTITYRARTIKNSTELNRKVTLEHLEIERRYWEAKGIEWKLVTDKQLDKQYVKNIEWVREALLNQDDMIVNSLGYCDALITCLEANQEIDLKRLFKQFEEINGLSIGVGLYLFRYLIGSKKLIINMEKKIDINSRIAKLLKE